MSATPEDTLERKSSKNITKFSNYKWKKNKNHYALTEENQKWQLTEESKKSLRHLGGVTSITTKICSVQFLLCVPKKLLMNACVLLLKLHVLKS